MSKSPTISAAGLLGAAVAAGLTSAPVFALPLEAHAIAVMSTQAEDCFVTDGELPKHELQPTTVTGQPYSAIGRNRMTTTLADGNRIVRESTTRHYRDGQGRTRTEHEFSGIGPFALQDTQTIVSINDPVAKEHYMLHAGLKRADVMPASTSFNVALSPPADIVFAKEAVAGEAMPCAQTQRAAKSILLGEKKIDGLRVIGTRRQFEIPAGEMGNELPLVIRSEEWYSPELSLVVASTHHDPLIGETTYKLEQISRKEPAAGLFKVPADYTRHVVTLDPGEQGAVMIGVDSGMPSVGAFGVAVPAPAPAPDPNR